MTENFNVEQDPLVVQGHWTEVFSGQSRLSLERRLLAYLQNQRWFGGKARRINSASFGEIVHTSFKSGQASITQIQVEYAEEDSETYMLPLAFASEERAKRMYDSSPNAILAELTVRRDEGEETGCLYDAVFSEDFCKSLVAMIADRSHLRGAMGDFAASATTALPGGQSGWVADLEVASLRTEQSNSSIVFGDKLILKLFRRTEYGINPDLELGYFLTEQVGFPHTPRVAGSIEYRIRNGPGAAVGILQEFVTNQGDAWRQALDALKEYFARAVGRPAGELKGLQRHTASVEQLEDAAIPRAAEELIGAYSENIKLLGRRTAELHVALASSTNDPDFIAEPFSTEYQRSLYESMNDHSTQMFQLLEKNLESLHGAVLDEASQVLDLQNEVANRFGALLSRKITAKRTRVHGDFHLGQVLFTGTDYMIIDFEGEPARPLSQRRIKRSPIRDVVGMLRSFHYAAYASLFGHLGSPAIPGGDLAALEPWAQVWQASICSSFLNSYLHHAEPGQFLPANRTELNILLNVYLLEKALYELGYELNNRPDWVRIPLSGLLQLLQSPEQAA